MGGYGALANIDDNTPIYLTDERPAAEARYRARFYFDPNSIPMTLGDLHNIFTIFAGPYTGVAALDLRFSTAGYRLRAGVMDDSGIWRYTTLDDYRDGEPHWQTALDVDALG